MIHVATILDLGIGDGVAANVICAVPAERLHGCLRKRFDESGCCGRLPPKAAPRMFPKLSVQGWFQWGSPRAASSPPSHSRVAPIRRVAASAAGPSKLLKRVGRNMLTKSHQQSRACLWRGLLIEVHGRAYSRHQLLRGGRARAVFSLVGTSHCRPRSGKASHRTAARVTSSGLGHGSPRGVM